MMQVVVQNTFLTIDEDAPIVRERSKSANYVDMLAEAQGKDHVHLERLNGLLFPKTQVTASGRVMSTNAVSSMETASLFPKFSLMASCSSMSDMSSDSELREEADSSSLDSGSVQGTPCNLDRVPSNSSVSTMATEGTRRRCPFSSSRVSKTQSKDCEGDAGKFPTPSLHTSRMCKRSTGGCVSTLAGFAESQDNSALSFNTLRGEVPMARENASTATTKLNMHHVPHMMPVAGCFLQTILLVPAAQMVEATPVQEATARPMPNYPPGTFVKEQNAMAHEVQVQVQEQQPKKHWLVTDYCHASVPKSVNLAEEFAKQPKTADFTSVMIRNIPNLYSQNDLKDEMEEMGFTGSFDFLYVPLDKGTNANVGYAFVNFLEASVAKKCMSVFEGHRFKRHRRCSGRVGWVSVAHLQGLEANIRHYKRAAVNSARLQQQRPFIMKNIR